MNGYSFTERVRKVLAMAREEAVRLHHEYVGTEHLLLGLLDERKGIAAQVLTTLGATAENAREQILSILGTEIPRRALRSTTNTPPEGVAPLAVDLVLRYENGAVVRKSFKAASEAASFLLGQ